VLLPALVGAAGALTAGVTAVVYATFSARVMPALARLPDAVGIERMQAFNRTAVQPPFMVCFFGAAAAGAYLLVRLLRSERTPADLLLAAGGALYLGGFALTVVVNVPLNDRLASVATRSPEAVALWQAYLGEWTRANTVRGVLSALATAALLAGTVGVLRHDP